MRKSQLKRLAFIAIVITMMIYLSRVFQMRSVDWWPDPPNKLETSLRDSIGVRGHSKLPVDPAIKGGAKHESNPKKEEDRIIPVIPANGGSKQESNPRKENDRGKEQQDGKKKLTLEYEMSILSLLDVPMEAKMKEIGDLRQERLAKECAIRKLNGSNVGNNGTVNSKLHFKAELLVSDDHKVLFCSTGSKHSEEWRKILGGVKLRSLQSYREESVSYRLRFYYKILPIEQPLVRFLSAYKTALLPHLDQKLLDSDGNDNYEKLQKLSLQISQQFNPGSRNVTKHARLEDFAEFVMTGVKTDAPLHPLWERIHVLCQPCSLRYDYISRAQSAHEDAKYIFSKLETPPQNQYSAVHAESSDAESLEEIRQELVQKLLDGLYEAYRIDHDLFGYPKPWD